MISEGDFSSDNFEKHDSISENFIITRSIVTRLTVDFVYNIQRDIFHLKVGGSSVSRVDGKNITRGKTSRYDQ